MIINKFKIWIEKKDINKVLVVVFVVSLIFFIFYFILLRILILRNGWFSNKIFVWSFVILIFLFVVGLFYVITIAKERSLDRRVFLVSIILIVLLVRMGFAFIFLIPITENCLAHDNICISNSSTENYISAEDYMNAFYFSAITLTTVGYGDIHPVGTTFKQIVAFEAIIGYLLIAVFVSYSITKVKS